MTASTLMPCTNPKPGSKFNIGDRLYCFSIGMGQPLITELTVNGIINNDDGIYYSADKSAWIKEEYLYKARKEAYRALIVQAENEMNQPEGLVK